MTRLDEIIANALAGIPETDAAILAREVVRLREARAVVVPELTNSEKCKATREWFMQPEQRDYNENDPVVNLAFMAGMDEGFHRACHRIACRAIPADRVLGEGERRICSEELMYLRSLERYARKHGPESIQDVIGCLDHLRANQEGAAT